LKRYQKRNEELFKGNNLEKIIDASEKLEEDFKRFAYIVVRRQAESSSTGIETTFLSKF
jgi:hypothetical protein